MDGARASSSFPWLGPADQSRIALCFLVVSPGCPCPVASTAPWSRLTGLHPQSLMPGCAPSSAGPARPLLQLVTIECGRAPTTAQPPSRSPGLGRLRGPFSGSGGGCMVCVPRRHPCGIVLGVCGRAGGPERPFSALPRGHVPCGPSQEQVPFRGSVGAVLPGAHFQPEARSSSPAVYFTATPLLFPQVEPDSKCPAVVLSPRKVTIS